MSEVKKLTEEELNAIKQIKSEYTNLALNLGELELQKAELFSIQAQIIEKENKLAKELNEKYGNGTINIDTGEITL